MMISNTDTSMDVIRYIYQTYRRRCYQYWNQGVILEARGRREMGNTALTHFRPILALWHALPDKRTLLLLLDPPFLSTLLFTTSHELRTMTEFSLSFLNPIRIFTPLASCPPYRYSRPCNSENFAIDYVRGGP